MQVRQGGVISTEERTTKKEYKRNKTEERKQMWNNKMYGQYCRETSDDIDKEKRKLLPKKSELKTEIEALICAAQEQALRTNYFKFNIVKTVESSPCRVCAEKGESVEHWISGCRKLPQKEYRRHKTVARIVHRTLCGKYDLE